MAIRAWLRTVAVVVIGILCLVFLLQAEVIRWDNTGHKYHLARTLNNFLKTGYYNFIDESTLFSYPANFYYGPLAYFSGLPFYLLSGDRNFVYNGVILVTCLLLVLGIYRVNRELGGIGSLPGLILAGGIYLLINPEGLLFYGMGASGIFGLGVVPFFFGIGCALLAYAELLRIRNGDLSWRRMARAVFLAACTMLASVLAVFFLAALALSLFIRRTGLASLKKLLLVVSLSVAATLFFIIPFLKFLNLTNAFSVHGLYKIGDPVLVLLRHPAGILFLGLLIAGVILHIRDGRSEAPVIFLILFAILPRNVLDQLFDLDIHYYRFLAPIMLFSIPIVASFLDRLLKKHWRTSAALLSSIILLITLGKELTRQKANAAKMREYTSGLKRILLKNRVRGTVFFEADRAQLDRFGTPYSFMEMVPLPGLRFLNGLFAESALVTGYGLSALDSISQTHLGGRKVLGRRYFGARNTPAETIHFLKKFYGLNAVIAGSRKLHRVLEDRLSVSNYGKVAHNKLFQISTNRNSTLLTNGAALLLDPDGKQWKKFVPGWINNKYLRKIPLIRIGWKEYWALRDKLKYVRFIFTFGYKKTMLLHRLHSKEGIDTPIIGLNVPFFTKTKKVFPLKSFSFSPYGYIRLHYTIHKNKKVFKDRGGRFYLYRRNYFPWLRDGKRSDTMLYQMAPHHIATVKPVKNHCTASPCVLGCVVCHRDSDSADCCSYRFFSVPFHQ